MASEGTEMEFCKDRQIQGMESRAVGSSVKSEVAILGLLLVSGAAGLATSSAAVTATMFLGGLTTWLIFTLPDYVQSQKRSSAGAATSTIPAAVPAKGGSGDATASQAPSSTAAAAAASLPSPDAVLALIKKRRSIFPKDYDGLQVPREELEMLLEAANWAPTHGQTEPWRFVVLEGESKREMEDLTMDLCRTRLPEEKAVKTLEKLQRKRDSTWGKVARESPEMKALLGLDPADRVMGFFTVGRIERERLEGYRASRGPWLDKVTWRS
ncbi:hypothetical protein VOLCADRAFT_87619 [Volvox carteri f. nagariensis]|uniref:Nitroreductase domain-containing protein n=1 Tax=Volvox carteri f. nagariensis TaxID=3068 RepID=D8TLT3_VOLCA|nr:uncharacterized protein VOLCADRAFT_87619 [Volvox carteri f. nagariensis]EFJ51386.1 hypothetical protein VOLCADRAFT_87619 [Volvox carteri f. nagariensis]|eukprot:XP_002947338.1 hypothetical protein VOLCADRAFT_87619 [Volvox carteri f. nagariensis]